MSTTDTATHDYTTGVPRHHHSLYLDDGSFVIQVENAIFNVHRSFLVKYSTVIKDMFEAPHEEGYINEGTDENPLILKGDSVVGWALLLESHYDSPSLLGMRSAHGERLLAILPIAHKYCMEVMEDAIVTYLDSVHDTAGYVNLLVASQIIDSKTLYDKALKALTVSLPKPNLEQARRIGVDALFVIMDTLARCSFPDCQRPTYGMTRQCNHCSRRQ